MRVCDKCGKTDSVEDTRVTMLRAGEKVQLPGYGHIDLCSHCDDHFMIAVEKVRTDFAKFGRAKQMVPAEPSP